MISSFISNGVKSYNTFPSLHRPLRDLGTLRNVLQYRGAAIKQVYGYSLPANFLNNGHKVVLVSLKKYHKDANAEPSEWVTLKENYEVK